MLTGKLFLSGREISVPILAAVTKTQAVDKNYNAKLKITSAKNKNHEFSIIKTSRKKSTT
jgi:hypothetical protein